MPSTRTDKRPAFLNLLMGGTGREGGLYFHELYEADRQPFTTLLVYMDTDPQPAPFANRSILIPLDGEKLDPILSDPATFGPTVETIVRHYARFLNPEDVGNGARTIRFLSQLAFIYYTEQILRELRACVLDLEHLGGFEAIIPVFLSSSGGGTGSALQILLAQALKDPWFFSRLTEGLPPGLIQTPVSFVIEPFAYALRHQTSHADKVLANAFAFREESSHLESLHAFKYVFHLGLANAHGAVLDTPTEIAKVLGTSVYQFERHWPEIKSRLVDTVDSQFGYYSGNDVPEQALGENDEASDDPSDNDEDTKH